MPRIKRSVKKQTHDKNRCRYLSFRTRRSMKSRLMAKLVPDLFHCRRTKHRANHIFGYLIFTNPNVEIPCKILEAI